MAAELSVMARLGAHVREELGPDVEALANPAQASLVSAVSFVLGAIVPIPVMSSASASLRVLMTMGVTLVSS